VSDQATETVPTTTTAPASAATPPGSSYIWGTGRRKTAVARVRLRPGSGKFVVNRREMKDYFPIEALRFTCTAPLRATDNAAKFDVFANVHGGGPSGQAGAVSLGLARALVRYDEVFEAKLRDGKFLTRDSRKVERKKYGRAGARRSFQWTKR